FQLASTALTVTVKAVPAVSLLGVPTFPVALPGAAVSPGTSSCSFDSAPEFTVIAELVLGVLDGLVISLAVTVELPPVLSVTLKVLVPLTNAAFAGRTAFGSEEVRPTVSVIVSARLKLESHALTVTVKAVPAV